jgi:FtsH-binding integral membrane protein
VRMREVGLNMVTRRRALVATLALCFLVVISASVASGRIPNALAFASLALFGCALYGASDAPRARNLLLAAGIGCGLATVLLLFIGSVAAT